MAVNIEALRAKIKQLQGEKKNSNVQMWKPGVGEYKIRIVPWKDLSDDGSFAKELWFYYLEGQRQMLAPSQFGQPDPVEDLRKKLFSTKLDEDRQLAKTLMPKLRVYSAIIVRGEESNGVQVWSYGKGIYQDLLNIFTDEDYGDITDVEEGFDLKVVVSKDPKKSFNDTRVTAARKPSVLTDDAELKAKWLQTPNLFDMYEKKSYDQVKMTLEAYINPDKNSEVGTSRGAPVADEVEALSAEVKAKLAAVKPASPKAVVAGEKPKTTKSLDDAFAELESDDWSDE